MFFSLPSLPFDSLVSGCISAETLNFHYDKHHHAYVDKLNALLPGSGLEGASLEDIVLRAEGSLLDNAAQAWNHTFYWHGFAPSPVREQSRSALERFPSLAKAVKESYGSLDTLETEFAAAANGLFGSGWTWLVYNDKSRKLEIIQASNADNPIRQGLKPLLTCDVWEHAYYIDFRNARPKYVDAFLKAVDWSFVGRNLTQNQIFDATKLMRTAAPPPSILPSRVAM